MRTIAAGALVLEPQTAAHAPEMFDVLSDPALYRYELQPPPSVSWLRERFVLLESRRSPDGTELWLNWVVRLRDAGAAAGYVQATVRGDGSAAIAYVLASRYWGRGLAGAAVRSMIDELAANYGVARLDATVVRRNEASLRLLDRLGFVVAAEMQRRDLEPGEVLLVRAARPPRGSARNVEIKARIRDRASIEARAATLADVGPLEIDQDDTYFRCAGGRLKLRVFAQRSAQLIFYRRADATGPKASTYAIARIEQPAELRTALAAAYGETGRVCKRRTLYLAGRTRIHLDRVEGLGEFLELEVVLGPDEPAEAGAAVADDLLQRLGIERADLVAGAYVDLLARIAADA